MSVLELAGLGLLVTLAYMTCGWLISVVRQDASTVDVFWGLGFVLLAVVFAVTGDGFVGRKALVAVLVGIWGFRLASYILIRNRGKGEDYRYQAFRQRWGKSYWWVSFFQVFMLQGLLMWIIAMSLMAAESNARPQNFAALDVIGTAVWCVGFFFEAVGDWQLARFKADSANRGKVMRSGLWAYTRHPNYFGEATMWWGLYLIAAGTRWGFWTIFSPVLITFMLLRVSGVALLERAQKASKPGYREYLESTSAFVPWFPRRSGSSRADEKGAGNSDKR
jgi:steroid 5-alpha reductase family enzyme